MLSKEQVVLDLKIIYKNIGKIPTQRYYVENGSYSLKTVRNKFGSWNNALIDVFGEINCLGKKEKLKILCLNCSKPTFNPKFCSKSCASSYNNSLVNGRKCGRSKKDKFCKCGVILKNYKRKKCDDCLNLIKINDGSLVSLQDVTKAMVLVDNTQKYSRIRGLARTFAKKSGKLNSCHVCGYDKHVECAHIIPINSFNNGDKITKINNLNNLVGLCPNHHWEFDNGILKINFKGM
jgi:hypothetical protein